MDTKVRIKEIMSLVLITRSPDDTVEQAAKTMAEHQVGSIIVTENGNNEGIVTERDICYKVVAKALNPSTVLVKDIMTRDLVTIGAEKTLTDAAKLMVKKGIRRLAVVEGGTVSGILTASDILAVSPKTIEVLSELYQIYANNEAELDRSGDELTEGGTCETCGTYTDNLKRVDEKYLCDDCREDVEG